MASNLILFTDTTNGNAYALVSDMETLFVTNPIWPSLDNKLATPPPYPEIFTERDNLILAATTLFDTLVIDGYKSIETQSLKFPRNLGDIYSFEGYSIDDFRNLDPRYTEEEQIQQLKLAVYYQIDMYLNAKLIGGIDLTKETKQLSTSGIDDRAYDILYFYMRKLKHVSR